MDEIAECVNDSADTRQDNGFKVGISRNFKVTKQNETKQKPCGMSINEYIAGALGGMVGVIVGHPFDTTKIQMQIRTVGAHKLTNTLDAFASVKAQGLKKGLFRGMLFPVLSYGLVNSTFFGVYGNTIKFLEPDSTVYPTNTQVFIAGCVAGTAQLVFSCPIEVIKCTLQAQIPLTLPKGSEDIRYTTPVYPKNYYKGPVECTKKILKAEGIRGLYKGAFVMCLRDIPSYGLYLVCYEGLFRWMTYYRLTDEKGAVAAMVSGGLSGCLSWLVIMPFDVIKSRLQVDHGRRYKGFWDCAVKIVQNAGMSVLFRGTTITLIRAFPVNGITFLVFSQVVNELNRLNPPAVQRKQAVRKDKS